MPCHDCVHFHAAQNKIPFALEDVFFHCPEMEKPSFSFWGNDCPLFNPARQGYKHGALGHSSGPHDARFHM